MSSIHSILKQYWGFASFRPLQEEIIRTVLAGKDCLALLPTGGGKSLCFQVPALAQEGLCLVVSPLIALMKDQVENLRKKNITAFSIHSGMTRKEVISVLSVAGNSNCKFLYVSPERLETGLFHEYLPSLPVSLIAVDEAHCISQWGYDFRPSYLRIAALREELPNVPLLALTASATPVVQEDICNKLLFREQTVFRQSFARPNLSFSVFNVPSAINKITEVLNNVDGTAIVYCRSRKRTKEISNLLNMHGISSGFYHAGLPQEERNRKQEEWLKNTVRVIVCTNAFGMGIDKPDVKTVIHADLPECLENYYQEAGRAGRDGKKSYAVLLYNDAGIAELEQLSQTRFPAVAEIRKVYQALMNHLQIPAGAGEGNFYEIDIREFIKQFHLDARTAVSALKTLEQEEVLGFSEQVFIPSRVEVTAGRQSLLEFEKQRADLDPLLKSLLRTYEGIADQPVNIFEKQLALQLKTSSDVVKEQLAMLHNYGMISYQLQKEKPQVYLMQNRVKTEDLRINMQEYNERKKRYEERIRMMLNYVDTKTECRSVVIANYFGDHAITACGVCDVCLAQKRKPVNAHEFENIHTRIKEMVSAEPLPVQEIMKNLNNVSKEKVREVIRFLQSENQIMVSENGLVQLKAG